MVSLDVVACFLVVSMAGDIALVWMARVTITFHNCNSKQSCSEPLCSPILYLKKGCEPGHYVVWNSESLSPGTMGKRPASTWLNMLETCSLFLQRGTGRCVRMSCWSHVGSEALGKASMFPFLVMAVLSPCCMRCIFLFLFLSSSGQGTWEVGGGMPQCASLWL